MLMWDQPLSNLLSTTKSHQKKLTDQGYQKVGDFLGNFPRKIESLPIINEITQLTPQKNIIHGHLNQLQVFTTGRGRRLWKAVLQLPDQYALEAIWFRAPYWWARFPAGSAVVLVGVTQWKAGKWQIMNPEKYAPEDPQVRPLRAVYVDSPPLTSGWWRKKMMEILPLIKQVPDFLPPEIQKKHGLLTAWEALQEIHQPSSAEKWQTARQRWAFEELFLLQVRVLQSRLVREKTQQNRRPIAFDAEAIKADLQTIPFELTPGQKRALWEVTQDLAGESPMNRLLQGDVGSGKTMVALLAAHQAIRAGFQAVILVPTDILARQHFATALRFFHPKNVSVELLVGATTDKNKKQIKTSLQHGSVKLLVGTHAVLTEDTVFDQLGLAIIDEQHRFGVKQRAILAATGTHVLGMTATPIPRSLALTLYGDQDLSRIPDRPPGRKEVITRVINNPQAWELMRHFIEDQINKGFQVFWVCPLIDESDNQALKNVIEEHQRLATEIFPREKIGLLHGRLKSAEKQKIMQEFKQQDFSILVSTSVIEVGVDIPQATVMVIENSDRFGLSQLHQFRGRIGRNSLSSYCFLVTDFSAEKSNERLKAMERTSDGLVLSELDLKMRGSGELYGTKQSGWPEFKCADLTDLDTLQAARNAAQAVLKADPGLSRWPVLQQKIQSLGVYYH